jgi:putative restriction endonuclease
MLCLCPNDHFLFDAGVIYVDVAGNVWNALKKEVIGPLRTVPRHRIDPEYLRYHREHFATG